MAEKALFLTQHQKTIEAAIEWIQANKEQADFNEELKIVGRTEQEQKSKLTPEEAAYHAKMLQKNLREKREQQEK